MDPGIHGDAQEPLFRAQELARRVAEHIRVQESVFKQRERFNRIPASLPPKDGIVAVLGDEQLDQSTVELVARELGKSGFATLSVALLDWLIEQGSPLVCKPLCDAVIAACCAQFRAEDAVRIFDAMPGLGLQPNLRTCNMVIMSCSHGGHVASAMKVLDHLEASGTQPNEFTAMALLQCCTFKRRGHYREALRAYTALESAGLPASKEVRDRLLDVCEAAIEKAPSVDAAEQVFVELVDLGQSSNTRAYNAMLGACARKGMWREAMAFFDQMVKNEVLADTRTFSSLIQSCLKGGALEQALEVFEWMVSGHDVLDPVPADTDTYNTLMRTCHQAGLLEKALEIMFWVESTGVPFDQDTYDELIGTVEVAQMWDRKALHSVNRAKAQPASGTGVPLAMFPQHLRPAPYEALRVMYLEHLEELEDEAVLALSKLGSRTSWAAASLTRSSPQRPHFGAALHGPPGPAPTHRAQAPRSAVEQQRAAALAKPCSPLRLSRAPSLGHLSLDAIIKIPPGLLSPEGGMSPRTMTAAGAGPLLPPLSQQGDAGLSARVMERDSSMLPLPSARSARPSNLAMSDADLAAPGPGSSASPAPMSARKGSMLAAPWRASSPPGPQDKGAAPGGLTGLTPGAAKVSSVFQNGLMNQLRQPKATANAVG